LILRHIRRDVAERLLDDLIKVNGNASFKTTIKMLREAIRK